MAFGSHEKMCEIEASVCTGFEPMAKEELEESFGVNATISRGRINAVIPVSDVKKVYISLIALMMMVVILLSLTKFILLSAFIHSMAIL